MRARKPLKESNWLDMIRKIGQSGELIRLFFYCFLGGLGKMVERKCNFDCEYQDDSGECEAVGTECIGDMCENWKCCQNCTGIEDCENIRM